MTTAFLLPRIPAPFRSALLSLLAAAAIPAAQAAGVARAPSRISLPTPTAGSASLLIPGSGLSAPAGWSPASPGSSLVVPGAPGLIGPSAVPELFTAPELALPISAAVPSQLPTPQAQAGVVERVRGNVDRQLSAMRAVLEGSDARLLTEMSEDAHRLLDDIQARLEAGDIDPTLSIDAGPETRAPSSGERLVKVGIYPVTADPFHWGHLLIGLQAVGTLGLDKVVYVLAGDDPRKPNMTKSDLRHPMGRAVLAAFAPFFDYSSIALGTNLDGETNMFRVLALNLARRVHAFYLVGADHYKLTDKNGNPDTLPKISANMASPTLGFDPRRHSVSVAFIERDERGSEVPTELDVRFLPALPFDASSTKARAGDLSLMPHDAYRWVLDRGLGLYGIH